MPMNCETARDLLLDHVYGALEETDDAALRTHLADCAACREALEMARGQREVLAAAARTEGPALKLVPPKPAIRIFTRRRAAVAAAVLVTAVASGFAWRSHEISSAELRFPHVAVLAPAAVAPGQPAEFLVQVTTVRGRPLDAQVRLDVYGADQKLLASKSIPTAADGKARLAFDAGLGNAGEQLRVEVGATLADGVERHASTMIVRDGRHLLARVATDKPLYRPGEPVRVRAVALERFRLTPAGAAPMAFEVLDPRGAKVASDSLAATGGVGAWEWKIPEGAPGGQYTLRLTGDPAFTSFPPTERKFVVRSYRVPRIKGDLELDRDSYGPGDAGVLSLTVERAEGGVPAGATLESVVTVDGKEVARQTQTLAASGRAKVEFKLPQAVAEGRGQVAVVVRDGGSVETLAKSIPIALGRLEVAYFPEGGDLVAGLANRVYFQVKEPQGAPADLTADVVDEAGRKVAEAHVDDLGMGRFDLTPEAGVTYRLEARKPSGIELRGDFPVAVRSGVVLRALDETTAAGKPIRVEIAATSVGRHALSAWCRGALIAQDAVDLAAGERRVVELRPTADVGGVARVTAFDPAGTPRAERLVSLTPPHRIDLDVRPSAKSYAPGEMVKVEVTSRDETGRPVAAVLGVSVIDEAVVKLANDEDTAAFPLHFLLGLEVEELERADVYVRGEHAARAVDRLLGVQGWRRFAWKAPAEFVTKHRDAGARVVVASAADTPQRADNLAEASSSVAWAERRADRNLRGVALAGGAGVLLLGGIAVLVVTRRTGIAAIVGGLTVVGCLVAVVALTVPRMQSGAFAPTADAVAFDAKAKPAAPPRVGRIAPGDKLEIPDAPMGGAEAWKAGLDLSAPPAGQPVADLFVAEEAQDIEVRAEEAKRRGFLAQGAPKPMEPDFRARRENVYVLTRVYAHRRAPAADGTRRDFAEVLYWNPLLVTDAHGKATFDFDTSDSVTTFTIGLDAHDGRGALATTAAPIRNRIPFYLEPKLPVALSAGDVLRLPVVIANDTDAALDAGVDLVLGSSLLRNQGSAAVATRVAAGARGRVLFDLLAGQGAGEVALTITGRGTGLADTSVRKIPIQPRGYPIDIAKGGVLERRDVVLVQLPDDFDRSTLTGSLRLYPTTLSTIQDGLEAMLREPCGCFEQASSSNYPNVLVLNLMGEEGSAPPAAVRRAKELLANGYAKLTGYECKQKGYEWFGGDPGHEALSAYGLMEFSDMAKVHAVDAAMISRTRDWLLARRDGKGGFLRNDRALDTFGAAPAAITNGYVTWSIVEADARADVEKEIAALVGSASESDDPYVVAMAARTAALRRLPEAKLLLDRLASQQKADGHFSGATMSITSSTGSNLDVETTAIAVMAFVTDPSRLPNAERGVRWLDGARKKGGGFGATQATILALRALVAHAQASKRTSVDHDIKLFVNGQFVTQQHVAAGAPGAIVFERELLGALTPGENRVEITDASATAATETLPWALALRYHADIPPSDPNCAVGVSTKLAKQVIAEGETVRLDVAITNRRKDGQPMTLARIGLPAGLEPREDQLKELKKSGAIDFWETRPREVTLYFRGLAPEAVRSLALDLVAAIPGDFEGPATSAYLYYTDDAKTWAAPLRCRVEAR